MRVYLHSDRAEKAKQYMVTVAPAADAAFVTGEVPKAWLQPDGSAKQIEINFVHGSAQVDDQLAVYLIKRGLAHRTRLVRAVKQFFTRGGQPIDELFDEHGRPLVLGGAVVQGEDAHA
jgi:hypothetical protein